MTPMKNIMLGTAGHVDHGKTAVVRMLTGCETDTLEEEKRRGLTIDIGFARCRMADENIVGVIDVPGHVDFIRNMVAGAHGIDVVIFVVAADDGVMPQTREHLDILTLMGTRGGLVALTKIDLVDPDMRQLVIDDVRGLLGGTFLADAPICPISNITGEGYEDFFAAINAAVTACPSRGASGLFRMWIEDVHGIKGVGTVATGIPLGGEARCGDRLVVLPGGGQARVRQLEVYGQTAQVAAAGQCVAMNLADVSASELARGMVLAAGQPNGTFTMVEAQLRLLSHASRPLKDYAPAQLHVGTAEGMTNVALLEGAKTIEPGQSQMVQLRFDRPLAVAPGDRYVIRADLGGVIGGRVTTIGGGVILSTSDIRLRRNRPWTLAALAGRRDALGMPLDWCEVVLREFEEPVDIAALACAIRERVEPTEELIAHLVQGGRAFAIPGGRYIHADRASELSSRALEAVTKFHDSNPQRIGLEQSLLTAELKTDGSLLEMVVGMLVGQERLTRSGSLLCLPGRGPRLSAADAELATKVEQALKAAGLTPPSPGEMAAAMAIDEKRLAKMLRLLADQGTAVPLEDKLYMHASAVGVARDVVLDLFARQGGFETVQFRDALGVSRKFAVPLLDYFDTVRLTARSGSRRTPGAVAKEALAGRQ